MNMQGIDRREFLKGTFATGLLVATARLPAWADDPAVFPTRGRYERLSLAYSRVEIGLAQPFSVLHISDTHFTAAYDHEPEAKRKVARNRTRTFGGRQEEALRDSLDWAKRNVDYVVHTGDLIDFRSEANLDLVRKYYGGAMFGSMGNHEFYTYMPDEKKTGDEAFKKIGADVLKAVYPVDIRFHAQVVNGVNFIALDDVFGYVCADQVERFRAEVKKGLPIVLCMHVPFHTPLTWQATRKFWFKWSTMGQKFRDRDFPAPEGDYKRQTTDPVTRDFIAYLKKEPLLKAILAGHEHITVEDRFSPTAMEYIVGGNFQFHGREVMFA